MSRADIGVAGMYVTSERIRSLDMSFSHSQDCAVFITLTSTALPRSVFFTSLVNFYDPTHNAYRMEYFFYV